MSELAQRLDRFFAIKERGSSVSHELRGAVATYLTMAYILFVNPTILRNAGVPFESAVACTAAAAAVCCLLMGLFGNFPLALASGMGLNAIVAFQVAKAAGSWQTAMGVVVLDGVVVLILVLAGLREAVMRAIPADLRRAIGAGIGLFIAFIGLVNARIVVVPPGTLVGLGLNPNELLPPVGPGSLANPQAAIALAGLIFTAVLMNRRVKGALILGILFGTAVGLVLGVSHLPTRLAPPSFAAAFQADVAGALRPSLLPLLFAIVMVDFFDTLGTATAIGEQAGLQDENGQIPRLRSILVVDSLSASIGGLFGASSVTSYIESAAGVAEGARTGLHTVVVGLLFAASIFLAPIAGMVPAAATAPALILVGFLMIAQLGRIDFQRLETAVPAFVTLVTLPLTYSIAHGVGYGFMTYVLICLLSGKAREVHPLMGLTAVAFAAYFVFAPA
jgi:AGZA family xanthine/uracil permease-like MFS transporter